MKTEQEIIKKLEEARQLVYEINLILHNKENEIQPTKINYSFKWFVIDSFSDSLPIIDWYEKKVVYEEVYKALKWVLK